MPPPPETFSKIKYVPDPYKPAIQVVTHGNSRKGIRQMAGGKGIKSSFNRLYEGEPPPLKRGEVHSKHISDSKFLTTEGFKTTSNTKVSNNRGDYTATFTKKYDHIPATKPESEGEVKARLTKRKMKVSAPRNVCTGPCKDEIFNKISYVTPSLEKVPEGKKKIGEKVMPFSFTVKNDVFKKLSYDSGDVVNSKCSENNIAKAKGSAILDCGAFRPSSPAVNLKAPIPGSFSPCKYESNSYDDKIRRRACTPERLHPLPKGKVWIS